MSVLQGFLIFLGVPLLLGLEIFILEVSFRYREHGLNPFQTIRFWFIRDNSLWKSKSCETDIVIVEEKIFKVYVFPVTDFDSLNKEDRGMRFSTPVNAVDFFRTYTHIDKEEAKEILSLKCLAAI